MNARENVNASLAACEETIQFLHEQRNEYRNRFASLIDFCNGMAKNVPLMLRCALEDIDNDNIPLSVTKFIYLCEDMMKRREEEARVAAAASNDALVQGVALQSGPSVPIPNLVIYGLPRGFVPPPKRTHVPPHAHTSEVADGVVAQGPPIVNQVVIPRTDEELQDEFEMQNYNGATPMVIPTAAQDSEAILMCHALAEKLRILEGHNSTRLSALEMCLVPDVVIPPKFKALEFEKYKGLTCPNIHLKMYCRKMVAYARDDNLMIHCFQDSLTRASLDWYMQLECSNIHTWDELAEAFAKQY
ncbi:uncharacterized protein LOC127101951 [Lathyrus oleraceus]|uniref:uncharacterized protein LOC127101951 n=1 Tax=Pisum sativum TaxID=3888 RepID=UPI0021D3CC06|nr:uncharacterized protein LOC127101951 [Pisum sativum]